jgi:hypothetical protein
MQDALMTDPQLQAQYWAASRPRRMRDIQSKGTLPKVSIEISFLPPYFIEVDGLAFSKPAVVTLIKVSN